MESIPHWKAPYLSNEINRSTALTLDVEVLKLSTRTKQNHHVFATIKAKSAVEEVHTATVANSAVEIIRLKNVISSHLGMATAKSRLPIQYLLVNAAD